MQKAGKEWRNYVFGFFLAPDLHRTLTWLLGCRWFLSAFLHCRCRSTSVYCPSAQTSASSSFWGRVRHFYVTILYKLYNLFKKKCYNKIVYYIIILDSFPLGINRRNSSFLYNNSWYTYMCTRVEATVHKIYFGAFLIYFRCWDNLEWYSNGHLANKLVIFVHKYHFYLLLLFYLLFLIWVIFQFYLWHLICSIYIFLWLILFSFYLFWFLHVQAQCWFSSFLCVNIWSRVFGMSCSWTSALVGHWCLQAAWRVQNTESHNHMSTS